MSDEEEAPPLPCCLCGICEDDQLRFGQLFKLDDIAVHHFCLLFSPHMGQHGKDDEGAEGFLPRDIKIEKARASSTMCCYCDKGGATSHCMSIKCSKKYHVGCAVRANGLLQFFGKFKSFCEEHRPRQNVIGGDQGEACSICLEETDVNDQLNVLWTPCCKHFFHRACLQRMAYHFGYFFYCPGCRNKDSISGFLRHMRHFGIFIPKRDASWEMVPNAFGELLERHLMCDVRYCLCVQGRQHQASEIESPWRLCVCEMCGSSGTHLACSDLPGTITRWVCPACTLQPEAAPSDKCTLRAFFERRPSATGEGTSSGAAVLSGPLSLHDVLAELEEPEQLIKFSISPISGLSVATRRLHSERVPVREPGGRPVQYHPLQLLPETTVTPEDQREAELRLWSENHVAAPETGGHCNYDLGQHRPAAAAASRRPSRAPPAASAWTQLVAGHNHRPPEAGPSPPQPLAALSGLPPTAELRAALASLQCPGCQQRYKLLSELTYHYQSHSGDALFFCKLCHERTSQWGSFHVMDHHPELPVEDWAQYVDSTFERAQALMIRLLLSRRGVRVTLEQARSIRAHYHTLVGGGRVRAVPAAAGVAKSGTSAASGAYQCPECGGVLRSSNSELVTAHKYMHTDEACAKYADRPHQCADCHFGSPFPYMLSRHRQRHHQRRRAGPQRPATPRPSSATSKSASSTPRPASVASESTAGAGSAEVTSSGIFECRECGKISADQSRHTKHMMYHSEQMRISRKDMCHHCPKCFYGADSLLQVSKHVSCVHGLVARECRVQCGRCQQLTMGLDRHRCEPASDTQSQTGGAAPQTSSNSRPASRQAASSGAATPPVREASNPLVPGPMLKPPADGSLKCQKCGKIAKDEQRFQNHVFFHTAVAERQMRHLAHHCPKCYYASDRQIRVQQHLVRHHQVNSAMFDKTCGKCNRSTFDLSRHICKSECEQQPGEVSSVPADSCSAGPSVSAEPPEPPAVKKFKTRNPLKCEYCGKVSSNSTRAKKHAYWHTSEAQERGRRMPQHCPKCFYAAHSNMRIMDHLRRLHGMSESSRDRIRRRCAKCGEASYNLPKHQQYCTNPGIKPDVSVGNGGDQPCKGTEQASAGSKPPYHHSMCCNICWRGGLSQEAHRAHRYFHTSKCKEESKSHRHHCPKCFFASDAFKVVSTHLTKFHQLTVKEFKRRCPRCGECTFDLKRHCCGSLAVDEGSTCKDCGLKGSREELTSHMYWHSESGKSLADVSPWTCPLCFFSSNVARKVRDHLEEDHKLDPRAYQTTCDTCNGMVFNWDAHQRWHQLSPESRADCVKPVYDQPAPVEDAPLVVPLSALMASGAETRADCPFCDDFFHSRKMYVRHMVTHHKVGGLPQSSSGNQCRFKYCISTAENLEFHETRYHKGANLHRRCTMCDAVLVSESDRKKHVEKKHSEETFISGAVTVPMTGHCWCSGTASQMERLTKSKPHLLQAHSVMIRDLPGPRKQPYSCPECKESHTYHDLIHHMASKHCWPFKMTGEETNTDTERPNAAQKRWHKKLRCPVCRLCFGFQELFFHLKKIHKWTFLESTADGKGKKLVGSKSVPQEGPQKVQKSAPSLIAHKLLKRAIGMPTTLKPKSVVAKAPADTGIKLFDCPFCDAFFMTPEEYLRHGRQAHSGIIPPKDPNYTCPVQYCYLPAYSVNGHRAALHKNPDRRLFPCGECSGSYNSQYHLDRHRSSLHAKPQPAIRLMGDTVECRCNISETRRRKGIHAWTYHGEACRPRPGPREKPYACPECGENLHFKVLLLHLKNRHNWRLKTSGSIAFGALHGADSGQGSASTSREGFRPENEVCTEGGDDQGFEDDNDAVGDEWMARFQRGSTNAFRSDIVGGVDMADENTGLLGHARIKQEEGEGQMPDPSTMVSAEIKPEPMNVEECVPNKEPERCDSRNGWVSWSAGDLERLDCPFCDSFFHGKHSYLNHMLRVHSGMPNTMNTSNFRVGICSFRYCFCQGTHAHTTQYHKAADDCTFVCFYCDRRYRNNVLCQVHMKRMHASEVRQGALPGDRSQCRCDKIDQKMVHLVRNHSITIRGYPGPRERPYICPKCDATLDFHALVRHLKSVHKWRLKETGQAAFGAVQRDSANVQVCAGVLAAGNARNTCAEEDDDNAAMLQFESGALDELEEELGPDVPPGVAKVGGSSATAVTGGIPPVFPCPFCDAFFLHKWEYRSHALELHSGLKESQGCNVAFCYGTHQTLHFSRMHKSAETMRHTCPKCDATFQSNKMVVKHVNRTHRPNVNTSMTATTGAEAQFATLCSCDVCPRFSHIQICHSVAVRGEPGPRAEPYECPECEEQLRFSSLLIHLSQQHLWRLKFHGEKAFRATHTIPKPDAEPSSMFHQNQHDTPTETRKSPTFVCHFCPYGGPRFEVRDHEKSQHIEEIRAFKDFAASCIPAESQLYVCPFCTYNSSLIWSFHQHLVKSEFCRNYLDADAQLWLAKSPVMKGPPPVFGDAGGTTSKAGPSKPKAPPFGGPMKVKLWGSSVTAGSKLLHRALTWKKKKPAVHAKKGFIFKCHFCPVEFTTNADVIRHQMFEHREPYIGFLEFARVCKRGLDRDAVYNCPSCSTAFPKNKVWKLRDHFFRSPQCTLILSHENDCWLQAPPPEATVGDAETEWEDVPTAAATVNTGQSSELDDDQLTSDVSSKRVYRCHFCTDTCGSTREVISHQETKHREAYHSFRRFAEQCRHKETNEYFCRFCGRHFHSTKMWSLWTHVVHSAACRANLDARSNKWLLVDTASDGNTFKRPLGPPAQAPTAVDGGYVSPVKPGPFKRSPVKQVPVTQQLKKHTKSKKKGTGDHLYKCFFCAFAGRGMRSIRTNHMMNHHPEALQAYMRFSDSCRNPMGMFQCPTCKMSKTHDRRWELREHFFIYNKCATALPPEADIWLAKTDAVIGGPDQSNDDYEAEPFPKLSGRGYRSRSDSGSVCTESNTGDISDGTSTMESPRVANVTSRSASDAGSSVSGNETAETRNISQGSDKESPVEPGTRRKRKAPEHWQAGTDYKQMTYMCHYCAYTGQKTTIRNHEKSAHVIEHEAYTSFNAACTDLDKVSWCPYCPWRSSPDRRWMLHRHMLDSASCQAQLPESEYCWLVEGSPSARAAVMAANRAQGYVTNADKEAAAPSTPVRLTRPSATAVRLSGNVRLGVERRKSSETGGLLAAARKKRKKIPSPGKKMVFRCHYCRFRGSKDVVSSHEYADHKEAHEAFTAFALANRRSTGGHQCPFCPWYRNAERKWALMRHIAESADCRSRLGPTAQSWLSFVQPAARDRGMVQPKGEEVLIPEPDSETEHLLADDIDDDPLGAVPDVDPLAIGGMEDPLAFGDDMTAVRSPPPGSPPNESGDAITRISPLPGVQLLTASHSTSLAGSSSRSVLKSSIALRQGSGDASISLVDSDEASKPQSLPKVAARKSIYMNTGPKDKCRFCAFRGSRGTMHRHMQAVHAHPLAKFDEFCAANVANMKYNCPFCEFNCYLQNRWALRLHIIRSAGCRAALPPDHNCWCLKSGEVVQGAEAAQDRPFDMFEPHRLQRGSQMQSGHQLDIYQCCYCSFKSHKKDVQAHQNELHINAQEAFLGFAATRRGTDRAYSCPHCLYKTMLARSFLRHFNLLAACRAKLGPAASVWLTDDATPPVASVSNANKAEDDDDIMIIPNPEAGSATNFRVDNPPVARPPASNPRDHTYVRDDPAAFGVRIIEASHFESFGGGPSGLSGIGCSGVCEEGYDNHVDDMSPLSVSISSVVSLRGTAEASSEHGTAGGGMPQSSTLSGLQHSSNKRKAGTDDFDDQEQSHTDTVFKRFKVEEIGLD